MFDKFKRHKKIRDIVQGVYSQYIVTEANKYGSENIDMELLAQECLLVASKISKIKDISEMEMMQIAKLATETDREWHIAIRNK